MHLITSSLLALASQNLSSSPENVSGYSYCSRYYGSFEKNHDCFKAVDLLDKGAIDVEYTVHGGTGAHALPFSKSYGKCMIQVDIAGPRLPQSFSIPPDQIRFIASGVMDDCVTGPHEIGGFATSDLEFMSFWITNPDTKLEEPFPTGTAFLTVTLTNKVPDWLSPGNYDPIIPYHWRQLLQIAVERAMNLQDRVALRQRATRFQQQAKKMEPRGGRVPWWENPDAGQEVNETSLDTGAGTVSIELSKPQPSGASTLTSKRKRRT